MEPFSFTACKGTVSITQCNVQVTGNYSEATITWFLLDRVAEIHATLTQNYFEITNANSQCTVMVIVAFSLSPILFQAEQT